MDPLEELIAALMSGHGMTKSDTIEAIAEMKEQIELGANPEDLLYEYGLEPDYIFGLI